MLWLVPHAADRIVFTCILICSMAGRVLPGPKLPEFLLTACIIDRAPGKAVMECHQPAAIPGSNAQLFQI